MSQTAFLGTLALALAGAKLFGHLFDRLRLPPILGQILAGIAIAHLPGPFPGVLRGELFQGLGDLGLLALLLVTGTESRLKDIRQAGPGSALVALGGVLAPFAAGYAAAKALGFAPLPALATGALFTPTSIGITAVALLEARRLRTPVGATLVGAAILDDVLALGLLAVVLGTGSLPLVGLKVAAFFLAAVALGWGVLPRLYRAYRRVHLPEARLTFVLVACFGLAALAEGLGLAAITGAFLAGLAVRENMGEEKLLEKVHGVAYGLLIPLFFIQLGASLELGRLGGLGRVAPLLLLASFGGKFLGAAGGALGARMHPVQALQVGVGMLPRLEVSLVVVAVAIRQGAFPGALGDLMTGVALLNMVLSLLLTPLCLRAAFRLGHAARPAHAGPGSPDAS